MGDVGGGRFGWWLSFRRDGRHLGHAVVTTRGSVAAALDILRTTGAHPAGSGVAASDLAYGWLARLPAHVLAAIVTLPRATLLREPRGELAAIAAAIAGDERRAAGRLARVDSWAALRARGDAAIGRLYGLRDALVHRRVELERLRRIVLQSRRGSSGEPIVPATGGRLRRRAVQRP